MILTRQSLSHAPAMFHPDRVEVSLKSAYSPGPWCWKAPRVVLISFSRVCGVASMAPQRILQPRRAKLFPPPSFRIPFNTHRADMRAAV